MCLTVFAYKEHPRYELVIALNRDEFLNRPTEVMKKREASVPFWAGRDLQAGGYWFGIREDGDFALVTNVRKKDSLQKRGSSRGLIVARILESEQISTTAEQIQSEAADFSPFNLLWSDSKRIFYFSSERSSVEELRPGIHGLSNGTINSNWPKVNRSKHLFEEMIRSNDSVDPSDLIERVMEENREADAKELPDTGVGTELEKFLSPIRIVGDEYGTRTTTVYTLNTDGAGEIVERTWESNECQRFEFTVR